MTIGRFRTSISSVVLIAALAASACGGPTGSPTGGPGSVGPTGSGASASPVVPASSTDSRIAGWNADLDALLPGIESRHPDPFHSTSKATLLAAVADLRSSVPSALDDTLMTGVMRIVALISSAGRDSHTGAYVWGDGIYPTHTLPLRLWKFPEGVVVVDALSPYASLIGRTIATIDGRPIEDVVSALEPLMPRDNDQTLTLLLPRFLLTTEILHGAGLIADPTTVTLGFVDSTDAAEAVTAIPTSAYNEWATPYGLHLPIRPGVAYLERSTEPLWFESTGDVLRIQYNRVTKLAGAELDVLRAALARPEVRRVIVDVRHNYGGETFGYPPVAEAIADAAAAGRWRRGLFLITGRNTYSAASLFTADLAALTKVTVVGETMGGSPALYGNARSFTLAYSGVGISVATEFFEAVPGDSRIEINPDLQVDLSAADFFAGKDPASMAIDAIVGLP